MWSKARPQWPSTNMLLIMQVTVIGTKRLDGRRGRSEVGSCQEHEKGAGAGPKSATAPTI